MGITEILAMIGGLALFLLGMNSMGEGLEKRNDDFASEVAAQMKK